MIFNELSLPPACEPLAGEQARDALGELVDTLRAAKGIRPDLALASHVPIGAIPVTAGGETFGTLAQQAGGIHVDRWRYVRALRNHAPFAVAPGLTDIDGSESYLHAGTECRGLGLAVTSGQLAVSARTGAEWGVHQVDVEHLALCEGDEGELVATTETHAVAHVSGSDHVATHRGLIADLALPGPFGGPDLWADRLHCYPHLHLLRCVEGQLRGFTSGAATLRQVHLRLRELDEAAGGWHPQHGQQPEWRSKVTPDSASRRKLCDFTDDDGVVRCFDWHARFTPTAGRIHFRLVPEAPERRLHIAYIGVKLGA